MKDNKKVDQLEEELPLISVVVLYYKNYDFIYGCIDSILKQNYGRIEMIISSDGSPDFEEEVIEEYIEKNKKENLVRYVVNQNKENKGIVKNANIGFNLSTGKYVKMIAADDELYGPTVLKKFVEYFEESGANVIVSQCAAYDYKFENLICYYPNNYYFDIVKKSTPHELFKELAQVSLIHSPGVCLRRNYMIQHGGFDEQYNLIEDWPIWLRMSRKGIKIHYLDMLAVKYRRGGISNDNVTYGSDKEKKYWTEYKNVLERECLPYKKELGKKVWRRVNRNIKRLNYDLTRNYDWNKLSKLEKIQFKLKYIDHLAIYNIKVCYHILKKMIGNKENIVILFLLGIGLVGLYGILDQLPVLSVELSSKLIDLMGITGMGSMLLSVVLGVLKIVVKLYRSMGR